MIDSIRYCFWRCGTCQGGPKAGFGNIACRGRAAALVCDYGEVITFSGEPQDALDKILAIRAVHPGRTQDHVPWVGSAHAALPRELAATVGVQRRCGIVFDIRRPLAPVKHVIGRDMNERDPAASGLV